jgi:hypothetical protein
MNQRQSLNCEESATLAETKVSHPRILSRFHAGDDNAGPRLGGSDHSSSSDFKVDVRRSEMAKKIMTLNIAADKHSFKLRENAN